MDDFFALEALLLTRLRATLPTTIQTICSGMDETILMDLPKRTPAVYVLFGDYRVIDQTKHDARLSQDWLVVVAVRSSHDVHSGEAARQLAGPYIAQVIQALLGWAPSQEMTLALSNNIPPWHYQPGNAKDKIPGLLHFPVALSVDFIL